MLGGAWRWVQAQGVREKYIFAAQDEEERKKWISILRQKQDNARSVTATHTGGSLGARMQRRVPTSTVLLQAHADTSPCTRYWYWVLVLTSTCEMRSGESGREQHIQISSSIMSRPRSKHRLLADPGTPGTLRVWCRVYVSAE